MENIQAWVQFVRHSILAVIIVIIAAVFFAHSWTKHTQRLIYIDDLRSKGHVEVMAEGIRETLPAAEADAKRKALELANGIFVNYQHETTEQSTNTITAESSDFSNDQTSNEGIKSSGEADFVSIDYLERKKHADGLFHVTIRAVVKNRHLIDAIEK